METKRGRRGTIKLAPYKQEKDKLKRRSGRIRKKCEGIANAKIAQVSVEAFIFLQVHAKSSVREKSQTYVCEHH